MKLNATELRSGYDKTIGSKIKKNDIYIILDDVLDTYNIGSVFRLADAVAAKKLILTSRSEIPPNHRIKKASVNTTDLVDWEYFEDPLRAIDKLRDEVKDIKVIAVELAKGAVSYDKFNFQLPLCLVVGNETTGVSKKVLESSDAVVSIPMFGANVSLNVMVSLAIVLYQVIEKTQPELITQLEADNY